MGMIDQHGILDALEGAQHVHKDPLTTASNWRVPAGYDPLDIARESQLLQAGMRFVV
jgi:hypothetical protein